MKKPIIIVVLVVSALFLVYSSPVLTGLFTFSFEYPAAECYPVDGIAFSEVPDQAQLKAISVIEPRVFGIISPFPNVTEAVWISTLDTDDLGYDFKKFYGNSRFNNLITLKPHLGNVDIIGYCPVKIVEPVTQEELSQRIDVLKTNFPGKEILIGPCVDLFEKVRGSENKPEYLGFELFDRDFDDYIEGRYDNIINQIRSQRVDMNIYIPIGSSTEFDRLRKVLDKAVYQNMSIGYMIEGSERIFNFITDNQC